jgi:hypothetical protein
MFFKFNKIFKRTHQYKKLVLQFIIIIKMYENV